jgi:hypothetical protein
MLLWLIAYSEAQKGKAGTVCEKANTLKKKT